MPIDAPITPPQSFDDLEAQLQAELNESPDDILPETTDAAQDDARSQEKSKEAPQTEKKPAPTEPKDTDPKAKKEPAPKDAKAKETERQDRSWKKLAEEREKDRLQREEIAKEKEAIARERAEIQRARDEARQQTTPPKTPEPKPSELSPESLTNLARAKRAEATKLRSSGDYARAEAAEKLAEEAEEYAKTLATTPAPQAQPKAPTAGDPKPGTPEFHAAQTQVADVLAQQHPDLRNPESPLSKATALALKSLPHLQRTPDGVAGAVAVAEVLLDRNAARQSEAQLKSQVETLTKQLADAQARIAGAPPGGGASNPPKTTDLAALPTDEAWERLRSQIS